MGTERRALESEISYYDIMQLPTPFSPYNRLNFWASVCHFVEWPATEKIVITTCSIFWTNDDTTKMKILLWATFAKNNNYSHSAAQCSSYDASIPLCCRHHKTVIKHWHLHELQIIYVFSANFKLPEVGHTFPRSLISIFTTGVDRNVGT